MTLRNSHKRRPPFVFSRRARVDQLVCDPRSYVRAVQVDGRTLYAPMLAWSAGPVAIGETGDNSLASLTGGNWLLQVCPDGSWVLYREQAGQLTVVPWDDVPEMVSGTARHPSLAFDQSARVVLAWEDEGIIKVRRWDPGANEYVENVTFAGHDPVVVLDAVWSESVAGSDVLLFYLSTDREKLLCRVQRDVYAVEYELWGFEAATVLDGVVALPWRYEVLVSDGHGAVLDPLLVSHVYPVRVGDPLVSVFGPPRGGAYDLVVMQQFVEDDIEAAFGGPRGGTYALVVVTLDVGQDDMEAEFSGPRGGEYKLVVVTLDVGQDDMEAAFTGPRGGEYALVVIVITLPSTDELEAAFSGPRGGSYVTPS